MNSDILLDYLISQSSGNTLYYYMETCPASLLKEAILRGFEIYCLDNIVTQDGLVRSTSWIEEKGYAAYHDLQMKGRFWGNGVGNGKGEDELGAQDRKAGGGYGEAYYGGSDLFGSEGEREVMEKALLSFRLMIASAFFSLIPLNLKTLGISLREDDYWIG